LDSQGQYSVRAYVTSILYEFRNLLLLGSAHSNKCYCPLSGQCPVDVRKATEQQTGTVVRSYEPDPEIMSPQANRLRFFQPVKCMF
jgi:hypothetical protein